MKYFNIVATLSIIFSLTSCIDLPIPTNQVKILKTTTHKQTQDGLIKTDLFRTSDLCTLKIYTNKNIKDFQLELISYSLYNLDKIHNGPKYIDIKLQKERSFILIHGFRLANISGFYKTDIKIILTDDSETDSFPIFTRWLIRRSIKTLRIE